MPRIRDNLFWGDTPGGLPTTSLTFVPALQNMGEPTQLVLACDCKSYAGCHSFCLSGYLHDEEAERFGRLVRPLLGKQNPGLT
tara:strand:+ start:388 stop:636 length:249 start_codon:yes stop_codon:yes gene_type:complete